MENEVNVHIPVMGGFIRVLKGSSSSWIRRMAERSEKAFPFPFDDYNKIDHMLVHRSRYQISKEHFIQIALI